MLKEPMKALGFVFVLSIALAYAWGQSETGKTYRAQKAAERMAKEQKAGGMY